MADWQRFFINFYIRNLLEHKKTQERILESAQDNERHFQNLIATLESEKLGLKSELDSLRKGACTGHFVTQKELSVVKERLSEMEKKLNYILCFVGTRGARKTGQTGCPEGTTSAHTST